MSHSSGRTSTSYRRAFGGPNVISMSSYSPVSTRMAGGGASGGGGGGGGRYVRSMSPVVSSRSATAYQRGRAGGPQQPRLSYDKVDFALAEAVNQEFLATRSNEKAELQELNDRFASFIDKVRYLEQQNGSLQQELNQFKGQQQQGQPSRATDLFQEELRDLKRQLEDVGKERDQYHVERDNLAEDLGLLRQRLDEEAQRRAEAESNLIIFRKDVDDATLARLELERKIESLMDEIEFLKKLHDEEIQDVHVSVQTQHQQMEMVEQTTRPDLTAALKDIRAQYENIASKNMQESEEWYKSKFTDLTESSRADALCQNESLLRQMREMEDQFGNEIGNYQDNVGRLEDEIRHLKDEMARHLREYQDLLNVKMALDIEIATYRKLLEGEESRITVPMFNMSNQFSMSHQSSDREFEMIPEMSSKRTVVIKTVETRDGEVVKESRKEKEREADRSDSKDKDSLNV